MKIQAFKNKNVETLCIKKFKISKNHLKREGVVTGSTIFKNENSLVKLVTMLLLCLGLGEKDELLKRSHGIVGCRD
jgi:hypothetical protein